MTALRTLKTHELSWLAPKDKERTFNAPSRGFYERCTASKIPADLACVRPAWAWTNEV